jgi:hypothetical protein
MTYSECSECSTQSSIEVHWTKEFADELQQSVNSIFEREIDGAIRACEFCLTIADPQMDGCPIVGCSTGFTKMSGYEMEEIVGRNCRFLVDPVPAEHLEFGMRAKAREYCASVVVEKYDEVFQEGTPRSTGDGIFCTQVNMRKDGTLFNNMFYLQEVMLSGKLFIIGLHNENTSGFVASQLKRYMADVERALARMFWYSAPFSQQFDLVDDVFTDEPIDTDSGVSLCCKLW